MVMMQQAALTLGCPCGHGNGNAWHDVGPVGRHDDDALMLLHLCQQHVNMVAAVLLPVLKNGFTLVKKQQCIMDFGLPAYAHTA